MGEGKGLSYILTSEAHIMACYISHFAELIHQFITVKI